MLCRPSSGSGCGETKLWFSAFWGWWLVAGVAERPRGLPSNIEDAVLSKLIRHKGWVNTCGITSKWVDEHQSLRNWGWTPTKSQAFKVNTPMIPSYFNAHVSWAPKMNEPNQNSPPAFRYIWERLKLVHHL